MDSKSLSPEMITRAFPATTGPGPADRGIYYKQGFFNVRVDFDRFVRPTDGHVELVLGKSRTRIDGRINRSANLNGTARIMGGSKLRDWFQANHAPGDIIDVDLSSMGSIKIL